MWHVGTVEKMKTQAKTGFNVKSNHFPHQNLMVCAPAQYKLSYPAKETLHLRESGRGYPGSRLGERSALLYFSVTGSACHGPEQNYLLCLIEGLHKKT